MRFAARILLAIVASLATACKWKHAPASKPPVYVRWSNDSKCGYSDAKGTMVVPIQFNDCQPFKNGFAAVKLAGSYGFIDGSGLLKIAPQWEMVHDFSEGLAFVVPASVSRNLLGYQIYHSGFVNSLGQLTIKPGSLDAQGDFSEGLVTACSDQYCGKRAFFTKDGTRAFSANFDMAWDFSEGLAAVSIGEEYGYINKSGAFAVNPRFHMAYSFHGGLARVRVAADSASGEGPVKEGFIDTTGAFKIDPRYDGAQDFSEGRAAVSIGELWGYVDSSGALIIKPQYKEAGAFDSGMAPVVGGGGVEVIDLSGDMLFLVKGDFYWFDEQHDGIVCFAIESSGEATQSCFDRTGEILWSDRLPPSGRLDYATKARRGAQPPPAR
jgi:hypothetical protein